MRRCDFREGVQAVTGQLFAQGHMAWFVPLMLLLSIPRAFGVGDACNSSAVTSLPPFVDHKTVRKGQGEMIWSFPPPAEDFAIVLTPSNSSVNPDMRLYMASPTTACQPMLNSQELGADYMRLGRNLTEHWNVSVYFLHVTCRDEETCRYHLALSKFEEWEEMAAGEQRSAIAYHGVPLHFKFRCTATCANASEAGTQRRITFSAWPRDASSLRHLSLLVRRGDYPTTNAHEHINASRGWFSGEVVSTTAKAGTYYVTVLKRHGLSTLPFVISVSLPTTIETLQLGKPTFGAAQKGVPSFYKFYVARAETDIEVYLTKLDGDPDCAVSHQQENERPTLSKSQWRSAKAGDDEISIPPADPERRRHKTGWFHVGVHSLSEDSTFSIIAFAENHVEQAADTEQGKDGYMIQWTELWMGLPQAMAAQPGRPANFLYYSQLAAPKLFVNIEAIAGNKPDVCVQNCGEDPHRCPWISIFASETTRASAPDTAVSFCGEGSLRGYAGDEQVTILKPCTKCWYTVLVTSALKRSRFKIQLGAEGRAHPLVEGESFKGHADSGDECPVLAYDLVESEIESRTAPDASLQISMTPIYGEPVFDVRKDSEDGKVLFNSSGAGHDSWELKLSADVAKTAAGIYYVQVCAAGPQHAQFRITVAWDKPLLRPGSAKKLGVAMLNDGEVQMGSISAKKHDVYLFVPASVEQSPTIRVSVTSIGGGCKLYVLAPQTGSESKAKEAMRAFLQNPAEVADWTTAEQDSSEIVISPSDAKYVAPTSSNLYVFLVSAETDTDFEIAASTGGVEELLTTGLPLRGEVARGEYRRYRVAIAEAGRHLSIQLTAENGDCDLYVHIVPDVSSESFVLRSENVGSDSIFVDAFSQLNQMHCGEKMIQTYGECVYFVAIKGISSRSAYQLQAIVPAALPLPLTMSTSRAVTLPPGGIQYFYTLAECTRSTLIEAQAEDENGGELAESAVKTAEHVASTIKFGYGSVVKAHSKLKKLVANEPEHKKDCKSPRLEVLGKCACPAGLRWDSAENSCRTNRGAMYFYMYRGQSDHNYPMNNVDMADLAGVMYYLHHEIVKTNATPGVRMNGITRILRWLVTVRPSQEVEEGRTFMPFVAFDSGRCSVPGCNRLWDHYGFAVGCQRLSQGTDLKYAYQSPNNPFGVWYSLPGPCPALRVGEKDGRCMATYRGGMCEDLEESQHCTYTVDFAGEIFLDELEGVKDFGKWQSEGNREYDPTTDRGTGTSFWNFRDSKAWCDRRTARVQSLFKRRYPLLPRDLPAPVC
ncbi:unnamed protein product [Symbiodinium necroappetens]|uniref:Uncharacterized protein n=1 Tax=Symbiodinium necroappetens TaxID=1628268 RepID=A0A813BUQ6_9DINO|nr:unnamed protein product [Symbiodinium necroappetens]